MDSSESQEVRLQKENKPPNPLKTSCWGPAVYFYFVPIRQAERTVDAFRRTMIMDGRREDVKRRLQLSR